MGREFVTRKSSVWGKKSDTKPTFITSRPFAEPTRDRNKVSKKELPKDIPPANYITDKIGCKAPQPVIQRDEENSQEKEPEQETDVNAKSDVSADDEENKVESVDIPPANYIFTKMGYKAPQPVIQREEENSQEKEPEQETDLISKSDASGDDENKEENINLKPAALKLPQSEDEDKKEDLDNESIQTKLTVGKPGDKYEQEADATAAKVMGMSDEAVQRNLTPSPSPMMERGEEEEIQRKEDGDRTKASSSLESRLGSSKGGGSPLADDVRGFMEPRFGADFSNVRVHSDSSAVQMNKELGAQAFAHGNDIYYGAGKSPGNNELTAHELTHTIQQTGKKLQPKFINQIAKKENKVHTSAVFPVQMKEIPVEGEIDSVENPQKEQQAGSAVNGGKEQKNSTSPQNKDGTAPQQNPAVTGENPTSPQETTEDKAEKSPKQETNPAGDNSGDNPQKNQQASSKQPGDKQSNAATPEKTSAKTAPASPQSDPDFKAVVGKAKGVANKEKKHQPANKKSQEAQDAAQSPASEVESKAQGNQVGEMEQAPTPAFNAAAFKAKLMERIQEAAPKNLDEADKFKDNNKLGSVKSEMQDKVKQEQTASQTPLEEKAKQAPDTSGIEPKSVTPLTPNQAGTATENIGAQKAIPKPKGQGEVEAPLQESSQKLDQQMADANVTDEQLAKSNEPEFQTALAAKQQANTNANQAPKQYRQFEQNQLTQAKGEASATAQQQLQGMHGDRAQLLSQVTNQQVVAKGSDEQKRAKIAGDIQGIYQNTKTSVDDILKGIEGEVIKRFDAGTSRAKEAYENYVAPYMEDYKTRYDGIWGKGRWLKDKLLGVPPKVTAFFHKGREKYLKEMDTTLTDIANYVTEQLNLAKEKIAEGRKEIKKYVEGLPASLQQVGQDAANNIQGQFDQLEQNVDDKHNQLINTLSQAYTKNLEEMDARIQEMKASNQPWFAKAFDGLAGVIETINKLKNMLMKVLAKVADTVGNIIKDPIGFLANLISGIKQGFENFVGNIGKHLQSGLVGWLTGALGPMGIQLPDDIFSLPGIFSLVTQVLGLTFNHIRGKAVKRFGEPVVAGMEQGVEIFQILRDRKAMGLWEHVKEQFNDLKETVIGEIKNMVITQVITAGVKWIIGLLNPASAFVKAAMAIYDIIMFFVNRGSQVLELVNSIVDAVTKIASGAVGGAAKLVENALSRALPVVIGFLASLLGVSGLAKKVEGIIGRVRERIDKAIDKVLLKAKGLFKGKKGKGKANKSESDKKHASMGKAAAKKLAQKPSKELPYDELRKLKEKEAKELEKKYNKQLEKPVKMTISFSPPTTDKKDGDIDFHIHIGPNDFDQDYSILHNSVEGSFKLAPGTLQEHEGGKILTSQGNERTIHVYAKHGPDILEASLEERLQEQIQRFRQLREDAISRYEEQLIPTEYANLDDKVDELKKTKKLDKINKKIGHIGNYLDNLEKYLQQANRLRGINQKDFDAVKAALKELDKDGPMPTRITTKFKNDKLLQHSILECLKANQENIDNEFISEEGVPKSVGTQLKKPLRHRIKNANVGIGYELVNGVRVSRISQALNFVEVVVIISNSEKFEYKVLTAFPSP